MAANDSTRYVVGGAFVLGAVALLVLAPVSRITCRREAAVACEATASILGVVTFQRLHAEPLLGARVQHEAFRSGGRHVSYDHLVLLVPGGIDLHPFGLQRRPEPELRAMAERVDAFLSDPKAKEMTPLRYFETLPNVLGACMLGLGLLALWPR